MLCPDQLSAPSEDGEEGTVPGWCMSNRREEGCEISAVMQHQRPDGCDVQSWRWGRGGCQGHDQVWQRSQLSGIGVGGHG